MLQIHPNARTTPITRAEIARSHARTGLLAQRYGVSTETIRKWRKRGAADCLDHSARPHQLAWKATEEERALVCMLRRVTPCCDGWAWMGSATLPRPRWPRTLTAATAQCGGLSPECRRSGCCAGSTGLCETAGGPPRPATPTC